MFQIQPGDQTLIDDVLDLVNIEPRGLMLEPADVDPAPIIASAITTTRQLADQKEIRFDDLTTKVHLPTINVDETRLQQTLLNLLSNGVKYNKLGGSLTLSVEVTEERALRMMASDTGAEIPEGREKELFKEFSRLGQENTDFAGTDIGLSTTKRPTEAMGGRVGFQSDPGMGSKFWLEFPIIEGTLTPKLPEEIAEKFLGPNGSEAGKTILCVEDNPSSLKLLEALSSGIPDATMVSAHSGEIGVDMATFYHPDLILMDINLPGMDGFSAIKLLKDVPGTSGIPVIALTAKASDRDVSSGLASGFAYYITKPIDVFEVTNAINNILETQLA